MSKKLSARFGLLSVFVLYTMEQVSYAQPGVGELTKIGKGWCNVEMAIKALKEEIESTATALLVLDVDVSVLTTAAERIRIQIHALARRHGIEPGRADHLDD